MVCDTVQEARYVALGGEERLKAVSLDGTVINKNGLITGGIVILFLLFVSYYK